MKINQFHFSANNWSNENPPKKNEKANLILILGSISMMDHEFATYTFYRDLYPNAPIVISSSAGEIFGDNVHEFSILVLEFEFENSNVKAVSRMINETNTSEIAIDLAKELYAEDLKYLMILNDGLRPNSSKIIEAVNTIIPNKVIISGGLSGDDSTFTETATGLNENAFPNNLVLIGIYGENFDVFSTVSSGWEAFGKKRIATKSDGNILYEIDQQPAYEIYKNYLGSAIDSLPGSGLIYPFQVKYPNQQDVIIRTVMHADIKNKSLIMAGEIPIGSELFLMNTNKDGLVKGAIDSSILAKSRIKEPDIILIISCIGRKMILGEWVDDEVEAVREQFYTSPIAGFYSFGEYAPSNKKNQCYLHNETMCLTLFKEHV